MKVNRIILRDSADTQFDDLIIFDKEVLLQDIYDKVEWVKNNVEDYTNEDVYKKIGELGDYTITWVGQYEIVEY